MTNEWYHSTVGGYGTAGDTHHRVTHSLLSGPYKRLHQRRDNTTLSHMSHLYIEPQLIHPKLDPPHADGDLVGSVFCQCRSYGLPCGLSLVVAQNILRALAALEMPVGTASTSSLLQATNASQRDWQRSWHLFCAC